jgi:tRNA 2-selenouridine synthase
LIQEITAEQLIENYDDYDLILDVRSPGEFAESHVPGARNFYAMTDEERKEVGTIYKQVSPFEAKVKGAAYVCKNAITHIDSLYPEFTPKHRIAIYCARGGMRSGSISTIFSNIGYRIDRVKGGYKAYRNAVIDYMEHFEPRRYIVLGGNTGCGKSDLLAKLHNVVDLEGLANHYGSSFGAVNGPQPNTKAFQNNLMHAVKATDPELPVFIESESKRIGRLVVPTPLYEMMGKGMRVEITAPLEQRVKRIIRMYENISDDFFYASMEKISPYIKRMAREEAIEAYRRGDLESVAEILLVDYYDVVYKKPKRVDVTICNDDEAKTLEQLNNLQKEHHANRL